MLVWVSTSSAVCKAYDVAILRAKDRIGHPIGLLRIWLGEVTVHLKLVFVRVMRQWMLVTPSICANVVGDVEVGVVRPVTLTERDA